jgi:hypothetical protein
MTGPRIEDTDSHPIAVRAHAALELVLVPEQRFRLSLDNAPPPW